MKINRTIATFVLAAVAVVLVLILIVTSINSNRERQANLPTPTPAPTPRPEVVDCRVLGGQIYLNDEEVRKILEEDYNLSCRAEYMGSFDMVAPDISYEGVDAVWTGSAAAYEEMLVNHPGVELDSDNIFVTFLMLFTWGKNLDGLTSPEANLVEQVGDAYVMDLEAPVQAILQNQQWADLGVPEIPGYVNFRFSAPESSGGGRSSLYLLGAYLTGKPPRPIRAEEMDVMLPQLLHIWESAGQQSDSSPENFNEFVLKGYPWVISSESLFIGWFESLPERDQQAVLDQVVGIYPSFTMSTDHRLVALTPAGQTLLDAFRDDTRLQEIGWNNYGMRLGLGGLGAKPGDTPLTWILAQPDVIADPKPDVSAIVRPALGS